MFENFLLGVMILSMALALIFGNMSTLTQAGLLMGKGFLFVLADLLMSQFLCKTTPPPSPFDVLLFRDTTCFPLFIAFGYGIIAGCLGVAIRIVWMRIQTKTTAKG